MIASGFEDTDAFGSPTITGEELITNGFEDTDAFGSPTIEAVTSGVTSATASGPLTP